MAATRSVLEVARSCGQEVDANVLGEAFARANLDVRRARARDPQHCHMGATLTVAIRSADAGAASRWRIAHSGDSPVFRVTPAGATAVTADHTVPGLLLAQRSITSAEAADHP
ncbi:MAG: hypothetical protein HYX32_10630 [Actinobacteria bacterium]|nr:hypothetical protein [Actinomycetota bacterium]